MFIEPAVGLARAVKRRFFGAKGFAVHDAATALGHGFAVFGVQHLVMDNPRHDDPRDMACIERWMHDDASRSMVVAAKRDARTSSFGRRPRLPPANFSDDMAVEITRVDGVIMLEEVVMSSSPRTLLERPSRPFKQVDPTPREVIDDVASAAIARGKIPSDCSPDDVVGFQEHLMDADREEPVSLGLRQKHRAGIGDHDARGWDHLADRVNEATGT